MHIRYLTVFIVFAILTGCGEHETLYKKEKDEEVEQISESIEKPQVDFELPTLSAADTQTLSDLNDECQLDPENCYEYAIRSIESTIATLENPGNELIANSEMSYSIQAYSYISEASLYQKRFNTKKSETGPFSKTYSEYIETELINNPDSAIRTFIKDANKIVIPPDRANFHQVLKRFGRSLYTYFALHFYDDLALTDNYEFKEKMEELENSIEEDYKYLTYFNPEEDYADNYQSGNVADGERIPPDKYPTIMGWDTFDTKGMYYVLNIVEETTQVHSTNKSKETKEGIYRFALQEVNGENMILQESTIGEWKFNDYGDNIRRIDPFIVVSQTISSQEEKSKLFYIHDGKVQHVSNPEGSPLFIYTPKMIRTINHDKIMTAYNDQKSGKWIFRTYQVDFASGKSTIVEERTYDNDAATFEVTIFFSN